MRTRRPCSQFSVGKSSAKDLFGLFDGTIDSSGSPAMNLFKPISGILWPR